MVSESRNLEDLQNDWKQMYQHKLPQAATSKSSSQPKWPVHVDHCFARIILDSIVGIDSPWTQKIKSPAYKHMSSQQLQDSIDIGQKILVGKVDLVQLDSKSLELRGKGKGKSGRASGKLNRSNTAIGKRKEEDRNEEGRESENETKKMKRESSDEAEDDVKEKSPYFEFKLSKYPSKNKKQENETQTFQFLPKSETKEEDSKPTESPSKASKQEDLKPHLSKIALSHKTPFQKRVLSLICQVPPGKYTTYGAISTHLSSSPRAVGNALRNNPFAPHVPCHRVLASGGGLGGFHGSWGKNGEEGLHDEKKRTLLRGEGVRFDGKGKVIGAPWSGFS